MLIDLLELASNKTLEHDPQTQARLQKLQDKTMTLKVTTIGQSLSLTPRAEGLELSQQSPGHVDVTLSATIGAMIKISKYGLDDAELEPGELEISGDPIVGQRFAQLMSELNVDWESLLAEQIGDSPAKAVTFAASQVKLIANDAHGKFKEFVNTLIQNDLGVVADKQSVDEFLDEVDTLRADTDRLNARLQRLNTKA